MTTTAVKRIRQALAKATATTLFCRCTHSEHEHAERGTAACQHLIYFRGKRHVCPCQKFVDASLPAFNPVLPPPMVPQVLAKLQQPVSEPPKLAKERKPMTTTATASTTTAKPATKSATEGANGYRPGPGRPPTKSYAYSAANLGFKITDRPATARRDDKPWRALVTALAATAKSGRALDVPVPPSMTTRGFVHGLKYAVSQIGLSFHYSQIGRRAVKVWADMPRRRRQTR